MGEECGNECSKCGVCCKLFLINLNEEEYKSGFYRTEHEGFGILENFDEAVSSGANIIAQKKDGSCFYHIDGICAIHKDKPKVCKEFFCCSEDKRFANMIKEIDNSRD